MAVFIRNGWQLSPGMGGRYQPEWVAGLGRNTHQDDWIQPLLEKYFNERSWRLFNAGKERGTGTKYCNVCRYALASDFGIASITPFNYNVYQEIGLMHGLQKPILYLLNPKYIKKVKKLPFDLDDQIYIEHNDRKSLLLGIDNKIPLMLDKLLLLSGFDSEQKNLVKKKVDALSSEAKKLLKRLLLEGDIFTMSEAQFNHLVGEKLGIKIEIIGELRSNRFILSKQVLTDRHATNFIQLNESYTKFLKEILW